MNDKEIAVTARGEPTKKAGEEKSSTTEGYFLTLPVLLLGSGIFLLVCIFVVCVVALLCKRMTYLRERMETINYMSSVPYNSPMSHPYHESGTETVYDYAYDVDEAMRRNSDSGSYLEPNKAIGETRNPLQ